MISNSDLLDMKDSPNDDIVVTVYFGHSGENITNKKLEETIIQEAKEIEEKTGQASSLLKRIEQTNKAIKRATDIIIREAEKNPDVKSTTQTQAELQLSHLTSNLIQLQKEYKEKSNKFLKNISETTVKLKQREAKKTIISLLYHNTLHNKNHHVFAFKGCGQIRGDLFGWLFGEGIEEQCDYLLKQIDLIIKDNPNKNIKINAVGLSRGVISALLLIKHLSASQYSNLKTSLTLIDPVSGNHWLTTKLDLLNLTLANRAKDISQVSNLKNIHIFFADEKTHSEHVKSDTKWAAFIAPFFTSLYPTAPIPCTVDFLKLSHGHLTTRMPRYEGLISDRELQKLVYLSYKVLTNTGTAFSKDLIDEVKQYEQLISLRQSLDEKNPAPTLSRNVISDSGVVITEDKLNGYVLKPSLFTKLKNRPYLWPCLKYLILGLAFAAFLYFTGGLGILAVIPWGVGGLLSSLSAVSLIALITPFFAALSAITTNLINQLKAPFRSSFLVGLGLTTILALTGVFNPLGLIPYAGPILSSLGSSIIIIMTPVVSLLVGLGKKFCSAIFCRGEIGVVIPKVEVDKNFLSSHATTLQLLEETEKKHQSVPFIAEEISQSMTPSAAKQSFVSYSTPNDSPPFSLENN